MKPSPLIATTIFLTMLVCFGSPKGHTAPPDQPAQEEQESLSLDTDGKTTTAYWRFQFFLKLDAAVFQRKAQTFLPPNEASQEVLSFRRYAPEFQYRETRQGGNVASSWESNPDNTHEDWIIYDLNAKLTAQTKPKKLVSSLQPPDNAEETLFSPELEKSLDEKLTQLDVMAQKSQQKKVRILFDFTRNSIESVTEGSDGQNIAATLADNKGDVLDKNQLFRALLSRLGTPTRTVNGVLLKDRKVKDKLHQWVQVWLNDQWLNFDLTHGYFGELPNDHFILYYGDATAIQITRGLGYRFRFVINRLSEENALDTDDMFIPQKDLFDESAFGKTGQKETKVSNAIGRIAIITEDQVPDSIVDKIAKQAAQDRTKVYFYNAPYESHFFRGSYIAKILAENFETLKQTDAIFIQSEDDASLYALFRMARENKKLKKTSIFLDGDFSKPVGDILGYALYKLLKPKDLFITKKPLDVERAWDIISDSVLDGMPMKDIQTRWSVSFLDLSQIKIDSFSSWRQFLIKTWVLAAKAEVNLETIYIILILPFIALVIVVFRNIIGFETFGTFTPVLISIAFLTTGIFWGIIQFFIIVATGLLFRMIFHKIHIHLVARMAMQIAMVGLTMLVITIIGVHFGFGALVNISVLPMVIMAGMVENFTRVQMEHGTRQAIRLIIATLAVSILSYYIIDVAGIQSLVLVFPEVTLVAIGLEILIGRWNGIRLLEYLRFYKIIGPATDPIAESNL